MKPETNFVALLGTKGGPAIRTGSTNPTSNLLVLDGQMFVVDCGLGVTRGLVDQGIALKDIRTIFITHMHSDHYLDLGPLLHTAWVTGLKDKVRIFGPKGIEVYWEFFLQSMKADIDLRMEDEGRPDLAALVSIHLIDEGAVATIGDVAISALRNEHPPLVDTFALRFSGTRAVVFSGDTTYFPPLAEFAMGADLLIHEAMLGEALDALMARIGNADDRLMKHWLRSHTMAADCGKIAKAAGVKALALNHLIPADDPGFGDDDWKQAVKPEWEGELHIGKDGMRIAL